MPRRKKKEYDRPKRNSGQKSRRRSRRNSKRKSPRFRAVDRATPTWYINRMEETTVKPSWLRIEMYYGNSSLRNTNDTEDLGDVGHNLPNKLNEYDKILVKVQFDTDTQAAPPTLQKIVTYLRTIDYESTIYPNIQFQIAIQTYSNVNVMHEDQVMHFQYVEGLNGRLNGNIANETYVKEIKWPTNGMLITYTPLRYYEQQNKDPFFSAEAWDPHCPSLWHLHDILNQQNNNAFQEWLNQNGHSTQLEVFQRMRREGSWPPNLILPPTT